MRKLHGFIALGLLAVASCTVAMPALALSDHAPTLSEYPVHADFAPLAVAVCAEPECILPFEIDGLPSAGDLDTGADAALALKERLPLPETRHGAQLGNGVVLAVRVEKTDFG